MESSPHLTSPDPVEEKRLDKIRMVTRSHCFLSESASSAVDGAHHRTGDETSLFAASKPLDGVGDHAFEVMQHDDRGLVIRELSEGHEYTFYQSFDGSGGPGLAIGECYQAPGHHGLDHFAEAAQTFAKIQAMRLRLI